MDYVVGSVAALISGNVTPSRPKLLKRALTPTKHQPSPNVTPKSEFVDDRSIFLSPTLQKKKAIVKKSPKRIFQNPDLDSTLDEANNSLNSPKVDKVKKHLKEQLDTDNKTQSTNMVSLKSPKKKKAEVVVEDIQNGNENTLKKKKMRLSESKEGSTNSFVTEEVLHITANNLSPKKKSKAANTEEKNHEEKENIYENDVNTDKEPVLEGDSENIKRKNKKRKNKSKNKQLQEEVCESAIDEKLGDKNDNNDGDIENVETQQKHKKKKNKAVKNYDISETVSKENTELKEKENKVGKKKKKNKSKKQLNNVQEDDVSQEELVVNPNAITSQDTDSEHESDHEMQSDNENEQSLDAGPAASSDDEEEKKVEKKKNKKSAKVTDTVEKKPIQEDSDEEVKRTLFVGNVLFTPKCKKEIKRLFSEYGEIETVRIRAVPIKDATSTPKLAVIKNELHPERSSVNIYVKFKHQDSVSKALAVNNTVLNGHHLRVTRSDTTGELRDSKCSIFIGNMPFALEDEGLRAKFEKCGEIESVRIIRDGKTNVGKGFGYVNFKSRDAVELALALSEEDLTISNRVLRVSRFNQTHINNKNSGNNKKVGGGNDRRGGINRNFGNNRNGGNNRNFSNNRNGGNNRNFGNNRNGGNNRNFENNRNFGNNRSVGGNNKFDRNAPRKFDSNNSQENTGAFRRITNKRKNQDEGEGPPNKQAKKQRKEFVGRTAEKKKKQTFNKGQKKKKALSEILTK